MTRNELIKDAFRLMDEIKRLRKIGAEDLARLVQSELEVIADRIGWSR